MHIVKYITFRLLCLVWLVTIYLRESRLTCWHLLLIYMLSTSSVLNVKTLFSLNYTGIKLYTNKTSTFRMISYNAVVLLVCVLRVGMNKRIHMCEYYIAWITLPKLDRATCTDWSPYKIRPKARNHVVHPPTIARHSAVFWVFWGCRPAYFQL